MSRRRMRALRWPDGSITDVSASTEPRAGAELIEVEVSHVDERGPYELTPDGRLTTHSRQVAKDDEERRFNEWLRAQWKASQGSA